MSIPVNELRKNDVHRLWELHHYAQPDERTIRAQGQGLRLSSKPWCAVCINNVEVRQEALESALINVLVEVLDEYS